MRASELGIGNLKTVIYSIVDAPVIKIFFAVLFTIFEWVFHGVNSDALMVVYALVILDTVTGFMVACENKEVSSSGFFRFAGKVFIYMILLATAALVDRSLPSKVAMSVMYAFLSVTEGISILENLGILGYPVPSALIKKFKIMNKEDNHK